MTRRWNFRNEACDRRQLLKKDLYERVLEDALLSMQEAHPLHSGFKVGCSILNLSTMLLYRGSNDEYGGGYHVGSTNAVHAESSALDSLRHELRDTDAVIVATIGDPSDVVTPCGHCLDVLRTYLPMDTEILVANARGEAEVLTLAKLFPTDFTRMDYSDLSLDKILIRKAADAVQRGLVLSDDLREGAAVRTARGNLYQGVRIDTASYYPTSAVASAIAVAVSAGDPDIEFIALANRTGEISGFDRQRIFEMFGLLQKLQTRRIFVSKIGEPDTVMVASPTEILPYGFGIATLGLDEEMRSKLERTRVA